MKFLTVSFSELKLKKNCLKNCQDAPTIQRHCHAAKALLGLEQSKTGQTAHGRQGRLATNHYGMQEAAHHHVPSFAFWIP